ncbi:MAG: hypothetical protein EDM03_05695 [Porphyrobacter sp. IPPAS B-1204]|nr:MAG: hypothetical protein EDM03_05695 [Porphyrobacter sp. IPPAS B-1204]
MANRKLDMGKAWVQATGLIGANRDLVSVLAGIFLFIPFFVAILALMNSDIDLGGAGSQPDPEQIYAQIVAVMVDNWWALLLASIGQLCGGIAIITLLGDRSRPTVSEVLKRVPGLILPMFGLQLLVTLATQGPSLLAERLPEMAAALAGFVLLPITLYLTVKFSLANAVIVLERRRNPLVAMRESWRLTKGNSFFLFAFMFMLGLLAVVIGLILTMIVGLVLAALGERGAMIGNAAFIAGIVATFYTLFYAVTVSIYHQLAGTVSQTEIDLFD